MEVTIRATSGLDTVEALIRDGYEVEIRSGTKNAATPWTGVAWLVIHPTGGNLRWNGRGSTVAEVISVIASFDQSFRQYDEEPPPPTKKRWRKR